MDESNVLYFKSDNLEDLSALMRGWYIRNPAEEISYGGRIARRTPAITTFQIVQETNEFGSLTGDWVCIAVWRVRIDY